MLKCSWYFGVLGLKSTWQFQACFVNNVCFFCFFFAVVVYFVIVRERKMKSGKKMLI